MWESSKIWESSSFAKEQYSMLYKTQLQAYETATVKKKKKKKKVSPKKPLNSYAAFYRDNFEQLRAENPELNVQEIAKLMGSRWKADTAARERYSNLRKSQMAAFEDTASATASTTKSGQPKKPLNSYAAYYRDNFEAMRAENPELNVQEIAKLMGSRWKADTAARERYANQRKSQLQSFNENASLNQTVDETGALVQAPPTNKKPLNSYAAYYRDNFEALRAENPGLNVQEIAKLMGSRWKQDTAARERYGMIRKAQMQTYEENQRIAQGLDPNVPLDSSSGGSGVPAAQKPQTSSSGVEMPKKPLNAYAAYYQDHFETIKMENPGLNTKEIAKIASYRWKTDTASRKKYSIIYKAQMAAYKERPPPPFNSYYQDIFETLRAQNPDLDVLALTKLADQMWKADTATKEKYTMLYKIQLQAYYEKLKQQGLYRFPQ